MNRINRTLCILLGELFLGAPLFFSARAQSESEATLPHHSIPEVVVTAARHESDPRLAPMSLSVIDSASLHERQHPSLLPLLGEQVPGLFATARGVMGYGVSTGAAGAISLRGVGGSPTTGLLILIDGQPQYMGLMGHPIADGCLTHSAERVEVVRGPASVLYGSNAMGGVINIITRPHTREGFSGALRAGYGSYNSLESAASGEVRKGRFSAALRAHYNRTDGHRPRIGFEQGGGALQLGYALGEHWQLAADGEAFHFNASNPGSLDAPLWENDSRITRYRASMRLQNHYRQATGNLTLFFSGGRHRINDGHAPEEPPLAYRFHSRDWMGGLSVYESLALFRGNRTTLGVDWFHFGGESWNLFPADGHRESVHRKQQDEVAAYVDFRQQIRHWLLLDAGLRVDHHSHVGTEWIPQFSLTLRLPHQTELRATLSKGFRFPTIREMYLFPPQNPDLNPERLWNYEIALSGQEPKKGIRYGINLFYLQGENRIQTTMIEGRPRHTNTGRIENWGVEGEISAALCRHLNLQANYSYLWMRYPTLSAPEHKLYGALHYTRKRWNLSTGLQYIRGLYTQLATASEPAQKEEFVLWSARGSVELTPWLQLWVRGENLLAQRYEINRGFPMPRATAMGGIEISF